MQEEYIAKSMSLLIFNTTLTYKDIVALAGTSKRIRYIVTNIIININRLDLDHAIAFSIFHPSHLHLLQNKTTPLCLVEMFRYSYTFDNVVNASIKFKWQVDYHDAAKYACKTNNVEMLKCIHIGNKLQTVDSYAYISYLHNSIDCLVYLKSTTPYFWFGGRVNKYSTPISTFLYFSHVGYNVGNLDIFCCMLNNDIETLFTLHKHNAIFTYRHLNLAASLKSNLFLMFFIETAKLVPNIITMNIAVKHDSVSSVKYLHSKKCEWNETTTMTAFHNNSFYSLDYILDNGCPQYHVM